MVKLLDKHNNKPVRKIILSSSYVVMYFLLQILKRNQAKLQVTNIVPFQTERIKTTR